MSKSNIADLALFGGKPAFEDKLHVGRPNIGDRESLWERINDALDRRWLSNDGPYVKEFEREIGEELDAKHCIAVCNGTIGLMIALRALKLRGEAIMPSFTFVATAHALQWLNIVPVFCDIDSASHNIDPSQIEEHITSRTAAILGVHLWGRPCDVDALTEIAERHELALLFDAAHAFCCSLRGKMIGNFGSAEVFSFHATKFLNTLEGGAIVTNDDDLARKIRLMVNFGFAGLDTVISEGINGKMNEISAAMGLTGLDSLDEFVATNYRNYKQYREDLGGIPGVRLLTYNENEQCNFQYVVLEIDEASAQISRDQLAEIVRAENVLARRYYYPGCHRMEPYKSLDPEAGKRLPQTELVAKRVLTLPTGTSIGYDQIRTICDIIAFANRHADEIRARLDNPTLARQCL